MESSSTVSPSLTIALPKGRTLGPVAEILTRAGVRPASESGETDLARALSEKSRALVRYGVLGEHTLAFLLLKPDDVPTYVEYGTADLGVCGRDVLFEREVDVYHPIDLGLGRCRLVVAGRVDDERGPRSARMPRVATKYPRAAAWHYARQGVQVEIVNVQGSVELAPLTGLADRIVDLVETGATLQQNGLEVKEEIFQISTLLVANRASYKLRAGALDALVSAVRGALTN